MKEFKGLCIVVLIIDLVILRCGCSVSTTSSASTSICQPTHSCNNTTLICRTDGKKDKQVLYILAMGPYPKDNPSNNPSWSGGPQVVSGVLLAAEHINCDPDILPDYRIKVIVSDGGCEHTSRAFANLTSSVYLHRRPAVENVVGVVGGACSESALVVAKHVNRDNLSLVQIAPSATSPLFVRNLTKYSSTMRLTVNALLFVKAFTHIIVEQKYEEVALLYDFQRSYMLEVSDAFEKALKKVNVNVSMNLPIFDFLVDKALEDLRDTHRLIFVFAGRKLSKLVLCMAYNKGMLWPSYQFIFINRRLSNFVTAVNITDRVTKEILAYCSEEQMFEAVQTATIFEPQLTRPDRNTKTVSGYTYNEIECQYNRTLQNHIQSLDIKADDVIDTEYQNAYYDSTWALAMSLHNAQPKVNLSTYHYGQPNNTKFIFEQFFNLSFEGAFGRVEFSRDTYDTKDVAIVNIYKQNISNLNCTESKIVAFYSSKTSLVNLFNSTFVDSSVFVKKMVYPPLVLGLTIMAVTIVVLLVIGVLQCINWNLGDVKNLKATSPQLNNLIFSGCYLLLLAVVVYSFISVFLIELRDHITHFPVVFSVFCNVQAWVTTYAFSLIFGTICMKTWRIWRIFTHFSSSPLKFAGDGVLVGFVVILITIDTVYLIVWISTNPLYMILIGDNSRQIAICSSDGFTVAWVLVLVCYKLLVIFFVFYLSIKTRKISRKEFKQTKSINMLIYIQLFNFTLGIAPYAIVTASRSFDEGPIIAAYVFYCMTYIIAVVFCIILVFLPPIYLVLRKRLLQ
ncbi:gamma-aminobutyric acid type B receptor subunit 1-like [Halichondria panicea]|uniref:gamma-aminobutyric acid type B receptor subunit 1-like n=1 Tax=Halichondria panicea TaxID=6063 RepID=UPI00312BB322